ncbi:MAG TPA: hydroxymethylbilane synthase [Mycobacteriales bacterium]|jgi:hydroxymethylbilane synthase|nr:hydroxymethylbilane synthase [Mycobacteriales bacterium]
MTVLTTDTLRLGTRRSALALAQSGLVAATLRAAGHSVEMVELTTQGDTSSVAVADLGTGVFVNELRRALLAGEIDLAVHSLKDLPTAAAADVALAAVPRRADPRDALVARDGATLGELPSGARVGTGSPRRAAQLRALGYGLEIVAIRGNVDTRIGKVASGDLDGVVVAMAGLDRLGRRDVVTEALDPVQVLPAPGQGALAVECRAGDVDLAAALVAALDDPMTRAAVTAERTVLARLEAGCTAPVGALADVAIGEEGKEEIYLRAVVANIDGARAIRLSMTGGLDEPEDVGNRLAANLLEAGAADLIGEFRE